MDYSPGSIQLSPQSEKVRSRSSLAHSSPVSLSESQGRAPSGLAISGYDIEQDQAKVFAAPLILSSHLVPETPSIEISYQDYPTGLCYPTIYGQPPNASEDSLNLYSPMSMTASPSYISAMEVGANQDAYSTGLSKFWIYPPCSDPTTPSDVVPGTGNFQEWDQCIFADPPIPNSMPLLPVNDMSHARNTKEEEDGFSIFLEQIAPAAATTAESTSSQSTQDHCSSDNLISASGLQCLVCGSKFTRRSNCKEHQKIHNPEWRNNHPCEECDRSFGRSSDLKRHKHTVSKITENCPRTVTHIGYRSTSGFASIAVTHATVGSVAKTL